MDGLFKIVSSSQDGEYWRRRVSLHSASVVWNFYIKMVFFFSGLFEAVNNICVFWRWEYFKGFCVLYCPGRLMIAFGVFIKTVDELDARDSLLSHWNCRRFRPSKTLHRVYLRTLADVSCECCAVISLDCLTLKMTALRPVETSVTAYQSHRRKIWIFGVQMMWRGR